MEFSCRVVTENNVSCFGEAVMSHMRPQEECLDALQNCAVDAAKSRGADVAEASGIGLWSWHPRSREFFYSREWLEVFGLPPNASLTGDDWLALVHPEDRDRVRSEIETAAID